MATSYMVCQFGGEFYSINADTLSANLHERWPEVDVHCGVNPDGHEACWWDMNLGHRSFGCSFSAYDHFCLSMEGAPDDEDLAIMAVWYRKLVPPPYRLGFFHPEEWPEWREVRPETPEQEVVDFIHRRVPSSSPPLDELV